MTRKGRKDARLTISPLDEYHFDLLVVAAWLGRRSVAQQATNLLAEKLDAEVEQMRSQIEYLSSKRGISSEDLWNQILSGEVENT